MEKKPNIIKGIGIIAVVVGHSHCPVYLHDIIYSFHMPLFFILSGFLFKEKYFNQKRTFLKKKIYSLYIPYVTWTIIFILLHNTFFHLGLINDLYGYDGKVNHLYSSSEIIIRALKSFLLIQGENFLGTFWFIRALFLGQIVFILFLNSTKKQLIFTPIIATLIFTRIILINHNIIPSSGVIIHQALFATFFISIGKLIKQHLPTIKTLSLCVLTIGFIFCGLTFNLSLNPEIQNCLLLPITGTIGFLLSYKISSLMEHHFIGNLFSLIGQKSFYIFALHFLMFKPISFLKIHLYNLDMSMLGSFPVIVEQNTFFWIAYSFAGIFLSILLSLVIDKIPLLNRDTKPIKFQNH